MKANGFSLRHVVHPTSLPDTCEIPLSEASRLEDPTTCMSHAKNKLRDYNSVANSLTSDKNSNGPITDPWIASILTTIASDLASSTEMYEVPPTASSPVHPSRLRPKPKACQLCIKGR